MNKWLAGKRAIVTGGSRGFGGTVALAFLRAGAHVLIVARNAVQLESARRALNEIAGAGQQVEACLADVGEPEAAAKIFTGEWAQADILVNNAGIQGPVGPLWTNAMKAWEDTFQIALFGPVALMQAAIPGMIERKWGRIINVSGGGSTSPREGFSAYGAAKTALVRASETVAGELSGTGVTVNAIAPGAMNTAMTQGIRELGPAVAGKKETEAAERLAKINGPPGERAAELCTYLCLPAADGITGKLIAALWDPWPRFDELADEIARSDVFTLRRIVPEDRGFHWDEKKD